MYWLLLAHRTVSWVHWFGFSYHFAGFHNCPRKRTHLNPPKPIHHSWDGSFCSWRSAIFWRICFIPRLLSRMGIEAKNKTGWCLFFGRSGGLEEISKLVECWSEWKVFAWDETIFALSFLLDSFLGKMLKMILSEYPLTLLIWLNFVAQDFEILNSTESATAIHRVDERGLFLKYYEALLNFVQGRTSHVMTSKCSRLVSGNYWTLPARCQLQWCWCVVWCTTAPSIHSLGGSEYISGRFGGGECLRSERKGGKDVILWQYMII